MVKARFATVGFSNNARNGRSAACKPNFSRNKNTSRVPSNECPPRSKKLSFTPTCSTLKPSTCAHTSASWDSNGVRGAIYCARSTRVCDGAGNALRSIFPFGVNGSESRFTNTEGIIYSGSFVRKKSRNSTESASCVGTAGTTYPTKLASDDRSFHAMTTACFTDGCPINATSISPVSMR